jgi:hypothetical protein
MPLLAGDMVHEPVTWHGFTLKQWYGTKRTAALQAGSVITPNEPRLRLAVKYLKGKPASYDATISMNAVECTVYNFDNPKSALDEANACIQRLAVALAAEDKNGTAS